MNGKYSRDDDTVMDIADDVTHQDERSIMSAMRELTSTTVQSIGSLSTYLAKTSR